MHYHKRYNVKKKESNGESWLTFERYILIAKKVGFSVAELKYLDVGDIISVAGEYFSSAEDEPEQEYVRKATQEDFDNF